MGHDSISCNSGISHSYLDVRVIVILHYTIFLNALTKITKKPEPSQAPAGRKRLKIICYNVLVAKVNNLSETAKCIGNFAPLFVPFKFPYQVVDGLVGSPLAVGVITRMDEVVAVEHEFHQCAFLCARE